MGNGHDVVEVDRKRFITLCCKTQSLQSELNNKTINDINNDNYMASVIVWNFQSLR